MGDLGVQNVNVMVVEILWRVHLCARYLHQISAKVFQATAESCAQSGLSGSCDHMTQGKGGLC